MASQDKIRGASHLEQLVLRHPEICDDDPVTLELLAKHSKVQLADMIEIYNKKADKPYELAPTGLDLLCSAIHKMEKEELNILEAKVIDAAVHCTLPIPSKPPPLIRQKGYFQPAPIPTKPAAATPAPPLPPRPRPVKAPEQKKDTRAFDKEALIKVYEYVNRCERWMRKEIKTQPTPKSLSNKYRDYIKK